MTSVTKVITETERRHELSWKGVTVGLDVSDQYTSVCVLDPDGEIIEEGRIRTSEVSFSRRFAGTTQCRIVLEVGTHSPWMSRLLEGLGHEVVVANPGKVRLIADSNPQDGSV